MRFSKCPGYVLPKTESEKTQIKDWKQWLKVCLPHGVFCCCCCCIRSFSSSGAVQGERERLKAINAAAKEAKQEEEESLSHYKLAAQW